jgi:tRNA threonylcarbamoyladenosine biosynthesis protein TsaE
MGLGRRLAAALMAGDVVTLAGPFGAGKTTFVQGIGRGLGIEGPITSPSFGLVNEYLTGESGARLPFFHFDLYRVRDAAEVAELDLDGYLQRGGAIAIEWPESAVWLLPPDRLALFFSLEGDARRLVAQTNGPRSARLAAAMAGEVRPCS